MSDTGQYWDKGWQLIDGCTPCSPGCDHCWSAAMAHRFKHPKSDSHVHDGLLTNDSGKFTGVIYTHPERLSIPLKRKKPTVYAVWNDLFHESVPFEFIKEVHFQIGIMDLHQYGHTFLILTKRPQRLLERTFWEDGCTLPDGSHDYDSRIEPMHKLISHPKNLWTGLTVCNQQEADEKIPVFLQVPGKKFLSIEPMLGEINLRWTPYHHQATNETYRQYLERKGSVNEYESLKMLDAVILGGETGAGARPLHPDWVRSVRDQCAAAGTDFFFKSWGEFRHESQFGQHIPSLRLLTQKTSFYEWQDGSRSYRIRKERAGRLLDCRLHDDLPWRA